MTTLPHLARLAERHVQRHGPTDVGDLVDQLGHEAGTPEHAEAALRLAVICGRLQLDRGGTLRIPTPRGTPDGHETRRRPRRTGQQAEGHAPDGGTPGASDAAGDDAAPEAQALTGPE